MQKNMARHPAASDIEQSLVQTLGRGVKLDTWQTVSGGSIHQSYHVTSQPGQHFFIKINHVQKKHTLDVEVVGLAVLQQHLTSDNPLRIPKVITSGCSESHAWLILEHITLGRSDAASQAKLGKGLAMLHQHTAPQFGFDTDNVIGESLQTNTWTEHWLDFWVEQRLGTQFKLAKQHGFYNQIANEAEQLLDVIPAYFQDHQAQASLLHGDLWGGNAAADNQGKPIMFDPAVYFGDRECDLAMTALFGGFSADFYAAYNDVYPLDDGYQQRKNLYNLYHILNHANLFGNAYIMQSKSMMQQLIRAAS
ncbi:MAG TPA: fructosamine kinase family protein [Ghiorsea sp.]|nr:fructosamine kinase family protein [Ghiorsea sp.]HIP08089.1 fructosamine kinase family protein [Mariprofundaceae bacterium]